MKYKVTNTDIFIGAKYYPEGSIIELTEAQARLVSKSLYRAYLLQQQSNEDESSESIISKNDDTKLIPQKKKIKRQ